VLSPQETAVNGDADSDDDDEADSDEDEGGCLFVLDPPIELNWSPTDTARVCLCERGAACQTPTLEDILTWSLICFLDEDSSPAKGEKRKRDPEDEEEEEED
jgi:hypothetical protein